MENYGSMKKKLRYSEKNPQLWHYRKKKPNYDTMPKTLEL